MLTLTPCYACGEFSRDVEYLNKYPYCQDCYSDLCVCDRCSATCLIEESRVAPGDLTYCEDCFDRHCEVCSNCDEVVWRQDCRETPNGRNYCDDCFNEHCAYCEHCDNVIWSEDAYYADDETLCASCYNYSDQEDFASTRFYPNNCFSRMGSRRNYGVEIETDSCSDYTNLSGCVPFEAKDDCSVHGKEFASAILSSDAGLEAIDDLCEFAAKHNWEVDHRCGLHIHLDMRTEKLEALKAAALAYSLTYSVWCGLVASRRVHNSYCHSSTVQPPEIKSISDFGRFSRNSGRYEWINCAAYYQHSTFEVRLHEGTIDSQTICNWLRIHAIFVDWATSKTVEDVERKLCGLHPARQFDFIAGLCQEAGCADLVDFYLEKAARNSECDWARESVYAPANV